MFLLPFLWIWSGTILDRNIFPPLLQNEIISLFGILLFLIFFYFFLRNYFLYCFVAEDIPFPFSRQKRLIKEGAFLRSRHPLLWLYNLVLLSLAMTFLSYSAIILLTPLMFIVFVVYAYFNEKKCHVYFKDDFLKYKNDVPFLVKIKKIEPKSPYLTRLLAQLFFRKIFTRFCPVEYIGRENLPENQNALFISNHLSYLDPFFLGADIHKNIRFLTTAEVFKKPRNRLFFHLMGSIPIKRFTKDPMGIRKFFKLMHKGYSVGYFPEGKRSWTGTPSEFPDGVLRLFKKTPIPIIPVSLAGLYAVWPRWAKKMRRARVQVKFHKPFILTKDMTEEFALKKIYALLYTDEKEFTDKILSKGKINGGINMLLWRCPVCGELDSIVEAGKNKLYCKKCLAEGILTTDNRLKMKINHKYQTETFNFWYEKLSNYCIDDILNKELKSGKSILYMGNFPKIKKVDTGTLSLGNSSFKYDGKKQHRFKFSDIKQLHTEGYRVLHFSTRKIQVQIKFLEESPLKWERFYKEMLIRSHKD
jgi:1-acyl-sn-glycerol-3-phosphate acyltransferase